MFNKGQTYTELTQELIDFCNSNNCYLEHSKSESGHILYAITANPEQTEKEKLDSLRFQREYECFRLVNQYRILTPEQEAEKAAWYQAWLDVTETRTVPEKPFWLK